MAQGALVLVATRQVMLLGLDFSIPHPRPSSSFPFPPSPFPLPLLMYILYMPLILNLIQIPIRLPQMEHEYPIASKALPQIRFQAPTHS